MFKLCAKYFTCHCEINICEICELFLLNDTPFICNAIMFIMLKYKKRLLFR